MTDRELLELAAKAAFKISPDLANSRSWWDGFLSSWKPLESDADAFRLAVRLRMKMYHAETAAIAEPKRFSHTWVSASDDECGDRYAATRRAIVRAAAEIGRGMPQHITGDLPEDNYDKENRTGVYAEPEE